VKSIGNVNIIGLEKRVGSVAAKDAAPTHALPISTMQGIQNDTHDGLSSSPIPLSDIASSTTPYNTEGAPPE
jgi:hypothetical protein